MIEREEYVRRCSSSNGATTKGKGLGKREGGEGGRRGGETELFIVKFNVLNKHKH